MLDQELKEEMLLKYDQYVDQNPHDFYPHQVDAARDTIEFMRRPKDDPESESPGKLFDGGSIKMATGTGKTRIQLGAAHAMGVKSVDVTPRIMLNTQTKDRYVEKLGLNPDDVAVFDSERDLEEKDRALNGVQHIITTPQGFVTLHEQGIISPDPEDPNYRPLLQLDESDTMLGHKRGNVFRQYIPNCMTIAYGATDYGVSEELFGGQSDRIHNLPINNSVERGLLTKGIKTAVIDVEPDELNIQQYIEDNKREYSEKMLDKFARNQEVINEVIRFHATHEDEEIGPIRRLPTLVTTATVAAAEQVAGEFDKIFGEGYAVAVSGETPKEDVVDPETDEVIEKGLGTILKEFDSGDGNPRVVIYPEILERGVDLDNATVLISMKPQKQPGPVEQGLGRLTRKGSDDYFEKFGNDKIALAVNVRTPELTPYLYSQVIGAPAIYAPGPRREYQPREHPPLPEVPNLPPPGKARVTTGYSELNTVFEKAEQAHRERQGIPPEGWLNLQDAANYSGLALDEVKRRAKNIHRGKNYTVLGLSSNVEGVDKELPEFPGSFLKQNFRGKTILKQEMLDEWIKIQQKIQKAKAKGYTSATEIAEEHSVDRSTVKAHSRKIVRKGATDENLGEADKLPDKVEEELQNKRKKDNQKE